MSSNSIRVHLVCFSGNKSDIPESFLIDYVNFTVNLVRDFIQKAVDGFIECHQHLLRHIEPQCFKLEKPLTVHRDVADFVQLLANFRSDNDRHVCFLSGATGAVPTSFFEHGVAVVNLPKLTKHHKELLSSGSAAALRSLGFGVGAALHEIGHLMGAFHSVQGIMSQRPNAIRLIHNDLRDSETVSTEPICFFDNYSMCIFALGPFFNRVDMSPQSLSVRYKVSKETVHIKCSHGILLIVVVKGTTYHDLKIYYDLPTTVTLHINEDCWDLIRVYNVFHHVENVVK